MSALRRLVIVRHGETQSNREQIWQGHLDTPLSQRGREQARIAARALAAYDPSFVVASDLSRAAQTAQFVVDLAQCPLLLDKRLREVNVGQWQGVSAAQVRRDYPDLLAALDRGEDVPKGVTGERVADLTVRMHAAIVDVTARLDDGETAVIVTHGVAGKVAVADLIGLNQMVAAEALRTMDNCHWADVIEQHGLFASDHAAPAWRLAAWNRGA